MMQKTIEEELIKKAGNIYIPENGRKLIVFLDDLNLATGDEFQSVPCLELVHMQLTCRYWYERKKWKNIYLQNVIFLCSSSPPRYGQKHPSQHFLSHFNVINILPLMDSEIKQIFFTLLKDKFPDSDLNVRRLLNSISLGSLELYKYVSKMFSPTPSRLHYIFSLRDFKKVMLRLFDVPVEKMKDNIFIVKCWFHECMREFSDKLISEGDRKNLFRSLCEIIPNQFLIDVEYIDFSDSSVFGKFMNAEKKYEEIKDPLVLQSFIQKCTEEYSKKYQTAPIVFFETAFKHLCQIMRGIDINYGNMLLIGVTGTGRRMLSKIAGLMLNYELFQIELRKKYSIFDFRQDLKQLLHKCGVENKEMLFILSEFEIASDEFLQCISEILSVGEVSDLFKKNELQKIYLDINEASGENMDNEICHQHFVENVKKHLHFIFCISYGTPFYRNCLLNYPAICKYSTIDWFEDWPKDALQSIAIKYLEDFDLGPSAQNGKLVCCQVLSEIHETVLKHPRERKKSNRFHSSASFISLVTSFKSAFSKKLRKVQNSMSRLESGLVKINETQEKVNEIAKETEEAREKAVKAEKACDIALAAIAEKKIILDEKSKAIHEKEIEIEKEEKKCKRIAIAAQEDLNAALPALESAKKALEALNKRDIGEIKSYAKPPVLVEMVLEAVMILRNSEPTWAEAKRQLGNPSFLKELIEYDRDNISDTALAKLGKYIKKPEFQPHIIGKVSVAARSLCMWAHAMHLYGEIYKKVKPKKERLRILQEQVDRLQRILAGYLKERQELNAEIEELEKKHMQLLKTKEENAELARISALKLLRANNIMQSLSSEKERWNKKFQNFLKTKKYVVGDSLLAAGYLSYLGPHDPSFRMQIFNAWKQKILEKDFLCDSEFSLMEFFVEEGDLTEWEMCGLPSDRYSHEGAAMIFESCFYPFILDPEGQAVKWLKNINLKQGLKICDLQSPKWPSIVENAIVDGYPVLLQTMTGELDFSLQPLLDKDKNSSTLLFNNQELKVHKRFQLFMSAKTYSSQLSQKMLNKLCFVNFTIKEKGLEDQLLPLVVRNERSDLEVTKEKLVKNIRDSKQSLWEIENKILKLLNQSEGSLLDDEILVESLYKCKSLSTEVEDKLSSSEKAERVIDAAREKYRPAAKIAAILYFVINDMSSVDSIYVFSLDSYINLFMDSINKSPKDSDVTRRIKKLRVYHQYAVFKFACRTISEKHSLVLAFHMCAKIMKSEGKLDADEYKFFISGDQGSSPMSVPQNPCAQWLPQSCWELIVQLDRLPKFFGITISFDEISKHWQEWYLNAEPEKAFLPGNWRNSCSEFEKLIIVRCLRVDRITSCVRNYVRNNLGKRFLEYPHMSLKDIIKESVPNKPIVLFMLSNDIDFEAIVGELAKTFGVLEKYRSISLGQGQGAIAAQLIVDAAKLGYWAFIYNCHLLPNWLLALDKIVDKLQNLKVNPDFRLLLGSSPMECFPITILQNSVVLTLDAPSGIRENLARLYKTKEVRSDNLESRPDKYKSLLFSLSFFHSVLTERKKFQNLGWNSHYQFVTADFKASVKMLQMYLNEYKDTPWDALRCSIAEICYQNHMTNRRDERLLMTYYEQYFCDEACANIKYLLSTVDTYYVPDEGSFDDYMKYIHSLPSLDIAEVFGQHGNAEIPFRIQEGESLLQYLSKIQGEISITKETSFENQMIQHLEELLVEVPGLINEEASLSILQEKPDFFSYLLVQEVKCYNALLKKILKCLTELEESIKGKKKMTPQANIDLRSIWKMQVPKEWQTAYPSQNSLGLWMQDLKLRIQQFEHWSSRGTPPVKFWLPGFTSPKSLLNAALITAGKKFDVSMKELEWEYHVSTLDDAHIIEAPSDGIYIYGLFLEGAGWDKSNSVLIDPEPLHLITAMPVIHFKPVTESSMRGLYTCPCYYTSNRYDRKGCSVYLFDIELKTKKPKDYWVKRGTAIILSKD